MANTKQNLMFIAKCFSLCVFCAIIILVGFGFANKALAGYATSTTFISSPIDLTTAYPTDLLGLHTDIPSGTSLSIQERSATTEGGLASASWTTAQSLTETGQIK